MPSRPTARDAFTRIASPGRRTSPTTVAKAAASAIQCAVSACARGMPATPRRPRPRPRSRARRSTRRSSRGNARSRHRARPSHRGSRPDGDPSRAPTRSSSAARIEVGFALYASLTTHTAAGKLRAPRRARPRADPSCALLRPLEREPECVVRGERRKHVLGKVPLIERQRQLDRSPRRPETATGSRAPSRL